MSDPFPKLLLANSDIWGGIVCLAGIALVFLIIVIAHAMESAEEPEPDLHIAGRRLVSQEKAKKQADEKREPRDGGAAWGGVTLPSAAEELYFLLAGSIGSGKTKNLVALLASVVPTLTRGSDRRMLLFDPKNELYSVLHSLGPPTPVVTLNPADVRSHAMSLADILTPAAALHLADTLLPKDKADQNAFFHTSVRNLFAGVFQYLILVAPRDFTLRDAVLILSSEHYLRQVVSIPHNRHLKKVFEPEITWKSIDTTIAAKLAELRILAAYWHHAKNQVNLRDWVEDQSSTLVLGMDPPIETTLQAFNRLFMKRLSELVLAGPEGTQKRTYVVIDELSALGGEFPVPGLSDLCHRGRSRGARCAAVFQTIEDIRLIYKDHGAHALLGEFSNKLLLRTEDPAHAKWCSEVMGETEVWEVEETHGRGGTSWRWVRVKRPLVLPSSFLTIAPANPQNGLSGYALSAYVDGAWEFNIPGDWVTAHLAGANPFVPAFVPRPAEHQYLPEFTDGDLARLKLRREPKIVT
ncbi:MAG: type IV secretion system DNA-binding domain-containing protein [Gemmataceae bacterium]